MSRWVNYFHQSQAKLLQFVEKCVPKAVSEDTGDRPVRGGLLLWTVGCPACRQCGRLVRQRRTDIHVDAFSRCRVSPVNVRLILQVLWEERLWLHLPSDRVSAGWKSRGPKGVQTWAGDSRTGLWRLLVETGTQERRVLCTLRPLDMWRHTSGSTDIRPYTSHWLSLSVWTPGQPYIFWVRPRNAFHLLWTWRTRHQILGWLVWSACHGELGYCWDLIERKKSQRRREKKE